MRVLIVGAGGHGQVVADILLAAMRRGSDVQPRGYLDHDQALWNRLLLELPVLGSVDDCARFYHDAVIVGVGDNLARRGLFEYLTKCGERFVTALHPSAVLSSSCEIGQGTVIAPNVVVNTGARVGENVILNTSCTVDHHNEIADHAHIAPGVRLGGQVSIGQGALIGIGATVMPRCRVGAWSIVGAGAVVTEDLADGVVAIGSPARTLGYRPRRERKSNRSRRTF
jgi:sugar O-acyltransferase (sialic acid O-acetyltransferase NeuD family)